MKNFLTTFFSNRTEVLFEELKKQLFKNSHPLTKRLIIIPYMEMKFWIQVQMAKDSDLGISAGCEIGKIEQIINRLYSLVANNKKDPDVGYEPKEIELALALEAMIFKKSEKFDMLSEDQKAEWDPLISYLDLKDKVKGEISKKAVKRTQALCSCMATLFIEYGIFGTKLVQNWGKEKRQDDWQSVLWKYLEEKFFLWNYPCRKLCEVELEENLNHKDIQVHVFCLSYIPPIYQRFLNKLSKCIKVNYYFISPCQKFWSDILTDKETLRLTSFLRRNGVSDMTREELEVYLKDRNELLANFGILGREMVKQIEMTDNITKDLYLLPQALAKYPMYQDLLIPEIKLENSPNPLTLLGALQSDIALNRSIENVDKVEFSKFDESIQIHAAPKPIREVQIVYDVIVSILNKHAQDVIPLTAADVCVIVSSVSEYESYIRSIFDSSESLLKSNLNVENQVSSSLLQGFLHFLELPQGRWDVNDFMRLFECRSFQLKHKITLDDLKSIKKWVKKSEIRWGWNIEHRNELLQRDHCERPMSEESWSGTWEHGLGRLLEGLALLSSDHNSIGGEMLFSPLSTIDTSKAELLGLLIQLVRSLINDLGVLVDGTKLSLKNWSRYLHCLCETYFDLSNEGDKTSCQKIISSIQTVDEAGNRLGGEAFPFQSIYSHLKKKLEGQSVFKGTELQNIHFYSADSMQAIPYKVIVFMGMSEGRFPRMESLFSYNKLKQQDSCDYYPKQLDFDRYLFLQGILASRNYFIATYVYQERGNTQEKPPSLVVSELLSYIEKAYTIGGKSPVNNCFYKHPLIPFHKNYFLPEKRLESFSKTYYLAARQHYCPQKRFPTPFLNTFALPKFDRVEIKTEILLSELISFNKHPLKSYFNRVLGIYLDSPEKRAIKKEEDLTLSKLDYSLLLKESLFSSPKEVLARAERSGKLPRGPFKAIESEDIKSEAEFFKKSFINYNVDVNKKFSFYFDTQFQQAKLVGNCWRLPPLVVQTKMGQVQVVGRIENIFAEGLITFSKDEIEEAVKNWPLFLVFWILIDTYELPFGRKIFFLKNQKLSFKDPSFADYHKLLQEFLEYYFQFKDHPSGVLPQCIVPILNGNLERVKNIFHANNVENYQPLYDEYLKWLRRAILETNLEQNLENWQEILKRLFMELRETWYPKRIEKSGEC